MRLPRTTVLELLETIVPDSNVLQACWELKNQGFRIALDDFQPSEGMKEIVALADYIKVDFRLSKKTERKRIRRLLSNSCATLIAEKVETVEELETAHQENFALFQGYVLARPVVFSKRSVRFAA
jgi:EAL and modified HD-GYP domain-containing signal transduction protein